MDHNEVIVLFDGYSRMLPNDVRGEVMQANCTCTLIKARTGMNLIVDTMDCWSGPRLVEALARHNLKPEQIDFCISTHTHPDHVGNNNLFLNAKHIVAWSVSHKDEYFIHDFQESAYTVTPDIEVFATKGHTLTCVSVAVKNSQFDGKTVGIVGDLFEREDDIECPALWKDAGSECEKEQRINRHKIAKMFDILVPGHGPMFHVSERIIESLGKQIKQED